MINRGLSLFLLIFLLDFKVCLAGDEFQFEPPRETVRDRLFNDGWLFNRADVQGAEKIGYDDKNWRAVSLPHDWSIEPIPAQERPLTVIFPLKESKWEMMLGDGELDPKERQNEKKWVPASPEIFEIESEKTYRWFRCQIAPSKSDFYINLGKIKDCDEVYLNGKKIGETGVMPKNQPQGECVSDSVTSREYFVPASLIQKENNILLISVYNHKGKGGFLKPQNREDFQFKTEIVGSFSTRAPAQTKTGYTVGGTAWYRKHFVINDISRHYEITFGGIYMISEVYINERLVGVNEFGYNSFFYDMTPFIKAGENVIAVRVRNEGINSRWYAGSGIYRNVWLTSTSPSYFKKHGTQILTPEVSPSRASVKVMTEIQTRSANCKVKLDVIAPDQTVVWSGNCEKSNQSASAAININAPILWDVDCPKLYKARLSLYDGDRLLDQIEENFGIRSLQFSAEKGFQLNGRSMELYGGCVHHDLGLLGAASFDYAEWRKVRILKSNGYNAVRASHNPMSDAFYEACDRLGVLVLDEMYDQWNSPKNPDDYSNFFSKNYAKDIEKWVKRNRNHPSIIIWSVGNEVSHGKQKIDWVGTAHQLVKEVKKYDQTRPVTAGAAGCKLIPGFLDAFDLAGYNYGDQYLEPDHQKNPKRISVWTESGPGGELKHKKMCDQYPWLIGFFTWAAWEYIGESWSGWIGTNEENAGWPAFASAAGALDLTGFPKGLQEYRNVLMDVNPIALMVEEPLPEGKSYKREGWSYPLYVPSWTWTGYENKKLNVRVISKAPQIRLSLNGKVIEEKKGKENSIQYDFSVVYDPGSLKAEAIGETGVVQQKTLITAGTPARLRLIADRSSMTTSSTDLCFVDIEVVDAQNQWNPLGSFPLKISVQGEGSLESCGNGFYKDVYSFRNPQNCRTWRGRAQAILKANRNSGEIYLTVESPGFLPAKIKVPVSHPPNSSLN